MCDGIVIRKIKQCFILSSSFFKAFANIFIVKKYDDTYVSLTPTKNADKDEIYCNALKFAIDNTEIKNIAISGNYGSGKSSIIKTFFEKLENKKYNPIFISLAAFNKNDYVEKVNDEIYGEERVKEIQSKNEFYHTLEKSILQQLLYQASEKDVPLSRFKRISKHSKILLNLITLSTISMIIFLVCIICPNIIQGTIDNYNSIITKIKPKLVNILVCISLILIYYITYKIVFFLSTKFNISKFKIKDAEVEIDNKPESIFNKYLDEIIYFFQVTNHNVVVIEDLDRYDGDASFIFQKLRELNTLINASNQVKYEVDFIYAIRDDFFENYEERTKFFDYIIPIIPISSSGNSNELIWERLEYLQDTGKINYKFDKSFIDDIAIMIEDKRLIDNIINEFIIYKNKYNNEHMDDKQLFSIIMYKNICPKSYADLQKGNGNIVEILKNKRVKIKEIIKELEKQQEILNSEKEKIIKESLNSIKELKLVLVSSIYDFINYVGYEREFQFDNESISINTFINSSIDIEKISHSTISFGTGRYSYIQLDETKVFSIFGNKSIFIERWKKIEKGKELKLEELQNEVEEIDSKIRDISKLTIKQLISQYGMEDIYNKNTKSIEKFLITKGYITEEYKDYITLFVPGNLTKEDNEFVFAVKTGEILPYEYKLKNIKNVLKKLNESDFETIAILNFDLIDYLIKNNLEEKENKIVQLLDSSSEDILQFIDEFIEKYEFSSHKFISILIENSTNLWKKIYKRVGNKNYIDKWVMRFLLDEKSLEYIDENFVEYINNHKDLDKYINDEEVKIVINSLMHLGIKLSNIQKITNEQFLKQIYANQLYKLNTIMIKLFLEIYGININQFEEKNLSIIMSCENELKKYLLDNFKEYFDLCYSLNKSNKDEESSILEILNNENINIEIKKKIIKNEEFKEYNAKSLDKDLIDTIVNEDKIKIGYNNILAIIIKQGELKVNIINHISNHIDEYKSEDIRKSEYDEKIVNLFIDRYIFHQEVNLDDFKILVKTFNIKINEIKEIEMAKLEYLIENDLIEFNPSNFEYIKNNILHKLLEFSINNLKQLIEDTDEYDISKIENELLISEKITREDKIKLIEIIDIEDLETLTILKLILKDIIFVNNESINKRILEDDNILINDKISFLKILLKNIEDMQQGTEYIHLIGNGYENINTSKNACSINFNKIDLELCNILKERGYISSYKNGKRNNIILYNKVNRE